MKAIITIIHFIILFVTTIQILGQPNNVDTIDRPSKNKIRNLIGFTPSKAQIINGIAFGGIPNVKSPKSDSLKIRGINIEINPILGTMAVGYVIFGTLISPFSNSTDAAELCNRNVFPDSVFSDNIKISGLNLGVLGSYGAGKVKGINLSLIGTFGYQINGLSTSIGLNLFYDFNGLLIGIQNKTNKGKGIQIGLFNYCNECKGIQIGLWNKMGKRTLPFINMRF